MSSIIKGGRIRNQTVVNLSERLQISQVEYDDVKEPMEESHLADYEENQKALVDAKVQALFEEAHQKAENILQEAQDQANQIYESAQVEKVNMLKEAFDKKEALLKDAEEEAGQIIDRAHAEKVKIIQSTEGELTHTLITLLQYLVGEEVYHNTAWLLCIVKRMLAQDVFKKDITIYVSKEVYERLSEEEKKRITELKENTTICISEKLAHTACKVEVAEGAIEYDVCEGLNKVIADIKILQNLK